MYFVQEKDSNGAYLVVHLEDMTKKRMSLDELMAFRKRKHVYGVSSSTEIAIFATPQAIIDSYAKRMMLISNPCKLVFSLERHSKKNGYDIIVRSSSPNEARGILTIPDFVTCIGTDAFSSAELVSVAFPRSVRCIADGAFRGCKFENTAIDLNAVQVVGNSAFRDTNITSVSGNPRTIQGYAFYMCNHLTSVRFGSKLSKIDCNSFKKCSELNDVDLSGTKVTKLTDDVFAYCTSLRGIKLPECLEALGDGVFYESGLVSIKLPSSVREMGERTFKGCVSLETADITGLEYLPWCAFSDCTKLHTVKLGNHLSEIRSEAFNNCSSLRKLVISEGLRCIGSGVFGGCTNLEEIDLPKTLASFHMADFIKVDMVTPTDESGLDDKIHSITMYDICLHNVLQHTGTVDTQHLQTRDTEDILLRFERIQSAYRDLGMRYKNLLSKRDNLNAELKAQLGIASAQTVKTATEGKPLRLKMYKSTKLLLEDTHGQEYTATGALSLSDAYLPKVSITYKEG